MFFSFDIHFHTCLSVKMNESDLCPTLWRTCRALAGKTRLKILGDLIKHPAQTVSGVAIRNNISVPLASISLRVLNARGLIASHRDGRLVFYSVLPNRRIPWIAQLVASVCRVFSGRRKPVDLLYRQATAFTHPRRITICHVLFCKGRLNYQDLVLQCQVSPAALNRHLVKLQKRGFVSCSASLWSVATPKDDFSKALLKILVEQGLAII